MTAVVALDSGTQFKDFVGRHHDAVVEFWAAWCAPCRALGPILEAIASDRPTLSIAKLNADDNPDIVEALGITGLPTTVVYRDGELVETITGAHPRPSFERQLTAHL